MLLIGPSAQLGLWILAEAVRAWSSSCCYYAGGLLSSRWQPGLYIGARLGPGPRDGLMTGIHARTGWRLWAIRTVIEVTVLLIGWALGGNFGPGTIAFALLIGPMVAFTIPWLTVFPCAEQPSSGGRPSRPASPLPT